MANYGFKASETLLGIETYCWWGNRGLTGGFKASETLLGIETHQRTFADIFKMGFKASETLLGIETWLIKLASPSFTASKPLKPF